MSYDIRLQETIQVGRPLAEVFDYLRDFSSCEEWDPGVSRACKLTDGEPAAGTEFEVVVKASLLRIAMGYTLLESVPPKKGQAKLLLRGSAKLFEVTDLIEMTEEEGGTRIDYTADFVLSARLSGLADRMQEPLNGVGERAMAGLKQTLDGLPPVPRATCRNTLADKLVLPGMWCFTRAGYQKAARGWKSPDTSMQGRHVLLTGATSGIGLAAARSLAARGARLTLVARSERKVRKVIEQLQRETHNSAIDYQLADLSLMADVNALAQRLLEQGDAIDVLVNNAGALFNPRQTTSEGLEQSFALLLLGPYLLTEQLRPLLSKSGNARVVNVLSGGLYTQRLRVDDLQSERGKYSGSAAYARAKRGLLVCTEHWAEQWAEDGISVNAMHPGWVDTPGVETALPEFYQRAGSLLRDPAQGADTIVWLASAAQLDGVSGQFWLDREPHTTHVFPWTRERGTDRQRLLDQLEQYRDGQPSPSTVAA